MPRSNLTIAVANNDDNNTDGSGSRVSSDSGGSSLVLRSDASGPAAVGPGRHYLPGHMVKFDS